MPLLLKIALTMLILGALDGCATKPTVKPKPPTTIEVCWGKCQYA